MALEYLTLLKPPMMTLRALSDTANIAEIRRRAAFEELWARERPRVWRLTARLSGDVDAADDLTQEVGLRALEAYGGFRGAAAESTWLYRIAVNIVLRWRERRGGMPDTVRLDGVAPPATPAEESPERLALRADADERMRRAVEALPDELRTPLLLHAWEGMKYREIAAVLEVPVGTVMSRLYAARQRLRRELGEDDAV
jgi:RNA polymerase sigma-70 factor (ECF subfamily)